MGILSLNWSYEHHPNSYGMGLSPPNMAIALLHFWKEYFPNPRTFELLFSFLKQHIHPLIVLITISDTFGCWVLQIVRVIRESFLWLHVPPPWHSGMTRILGRQKLHVTGTLCQMYCTKVYHDGYIVIVPNTLYIIADSLYQVYHPTITLAQWDDAHIGQKANRGVITTRSHVFTARNQQ